MDNTTIAQALLDLSNTTAVRAEHAAKTEAWAAGLHLPLPQIILSGTHPTTVRPHQFREHLVLLKDRLSFRSFQQRSGRFMFKVNPCV